MTAAVGWAALLTTAVALLAPAVLRPVLERSGVVDVPNGRSLHERPTLRGGGLASLLAVAAGAVLAAVTLPASSVPTFVAIVVAAVGMGLIGAAEDVIGLNVGVRAAAQLAVGGGFCIALISQFGVSWAWAPVGALLFAANVNFTNFMDGVNGISSLHGLVTGGAFAALGLIVDLPWLVAAGIILAAAFAMFLPWNLLPPGMFLGDVGSYLLGAGTAALALACLAAGVPPLASLAPLALYWSDTVITLCRRALRREPVLQAHRSHTFQRLTTRGFSHLAVSALVAGLTALAAALGLLSAAAYLPATVAAVGVALICLAYLALPRLLER